METHAERMLILKMIEDGKITAQEAADLLDALEESAGASRKAADGQKKDGGINNRWLRVRVTDTRTNRSRVNMRLPATLVNAGAKLGMQFAPEAEGIDINQIVSALQAGETGQIIDVYDEEDGEHVEVFIE